MDHQEKKSSVKLKVNCSEENQKILTEEIVGKVKKTQLYATHDTKNRGTKF